MTASHLVQWASSLAPAPLFWITATLAVFVGARQLQQCIGNPPWANPVLISIIVLGAALLCTGVSYQSYFDSVQGLHFLLGPATVALGVPLARNIIHVRSSWRGILLTVLTGGSASLASGVIFVHLMGGSDAAALSMAPKAATTPIAMSISQEIGGDPALTAAFAILGGIITAMSGSRIISALGVQDQRVEGFAAGVAGSGIAAAQMTSRGEIAVAFAALGIAFNGIATALIASMFL